MPFVMIGALDKNIDSKVISKMIGAKAVSMILISLISIEIIHKTKIQKVHKINVFIIIGIIIIIYKFNCASYQYNNV